METNDTIFLISFRGVTNKFFATVTGLGDIIKANNKYGINYIKEFNSAKDNFVRVPKPRLKMLTDYHTHTYQEIEKTGYFK